MPRRAELLAHLGEFVDCEFLLFVALAARGRRNRSCCAQSRGQRV